MVLYARLGLLLTALGQAPTPPGARVDLYTFGPGEDVFSKFGHAALCVFDENGLSGRCFNYGTADFSTPGPLTWDVVRGRAQFWVSVAPFKEMLRVYLAQDRTFYRQPLPLTSEQVKELRERLETAALPENRHYLYDHFDDNCSTRPRDHIDAVFDGALENRSGAHGASFRELIRKSLQDDPFIFVLVETFLGRSMDRERTEYEAMFLPRILREAVALHLGVTPEIVHARKDPAPAGLSWPGAWPVAWLVTHRRGLALGIGLGSALLIVLGTPGAFRALRFVFGALFGTVGVLKPPVPSGHFSTCRAPLQRALTRVAADRLRVNRELTAGNDSLHQLPIGKPRSGWRLARLGLVPTAVVAFLDTCRSGPWSHLDSNTGSLGWRTVE